MPPTQKQAEECIILCLDCIEAQKEAGEPEAAHHEGDPLPHRVQDVADRIAGPAPECGNRADCNKP
jgi:hypothetical protein